MVLKAAGIGAPEQATLSGEYRVPIRARRDAGDSLGYTGTRPSIGTPLARAAVSKYTRTSALAGMTI